MRTEMFNEREAAGLWEADKQRIIINRNQLKNLESFAGTVLHEAAHATSGASDVTEEFEQELTVLLGKLTKNAL